MNRRLVLLSTITTFVISVSTAYAARPAAGTATTPASRASAQAATAKRVGPDRNPFVKRCNRALTEQTSALAACNALLEKNELLLQECAGDVTERKAELDACRASTANSFKISFAMDDAVTFGSLQLAIDYADANGGFDGDGKAVQCTNKIDGTLFVINDMGASSTVKAAWLSVAGVAGPNKLLLDCNFTSNGGAPAPTQFVVTVVDVGDPNADPIMPSPTISVTVTPQ